LGGKRHYAAFLVLEKKEKVPTSDRGAKGKRKRKEKKKESSALPTAVYAERKIVSETISEKKRIGTGESENSLQGGGEGLRRDSERGKSEIKVKNGGKKKKKIN